MTIYRQSKYLRKLPVKQARLSRWQLEIFFYVFMIHLPKCTQTGHVMKVKINAYVGDLMSGEFTLCSESVFLVKKTPSVIIFFLIFRWVMFPLRASSTTSSEAIRVNCVHDQLQPVNRSYCWLILKRNRNVRKLLKD